MAYRLSIAKAIQKEIEQLPGNVRQRVRRTIASLANDPRPQIAKAMDDDLAGYYRIRLDNYRVIYKIDDDIVLVEVIRVARRTPKMYQGLP